MPCNFITMAKTYQQINERIKNGEAVVLTAEEVSQLALTMSPEEIADKVDVVTTGTFGAMCSSGAFINFGHSGLFRSTCCRPAYGTAVSPPRRPGRLRTSAVRPPLPSLADTRHHISVGRTYHATERFPAPTFITEYPSTIPLGHRRCI